MGRKRLPMKLISNKRARLTSFEKRKKGLKKAAYELSTLCGVDIGMVVCNNESNSNEPEVWPANPDTVARMIKLYESSSDQDRRCKTYGLSDYFKEQRERVEEQIKKMREKNDDIYDSLSHDQLRQLGNLLNARIGAVKEKISLMKAESDVLMDPLVLESRVFATNIGQQQQPWTYFDTQDNMNLEGSRNLCSESEFWRNSLVQESIFLMPNTVQEQQLVEYDDAYDNLADLMEGSRNPYLETTFLMNQSVQGTATFMQAIIQQQQHLAYNEGQNNIRNQNEHMMMLMMNGDNASSSQSIYNLDGSQDNYAYFLSDDCFQNCGMQTEIMENAGMNEVEEQFMSYHMPNEEAMLQDWQGLLSISAFPEKQAVQEGYYF